MPETSFQTTKQSQYIQQLPEGNRRVISQKLHIRLLLSPVHRSCDLWDPGQFIDVNSKRLRYVPVYQKDSWCHTADLCNWRTEDEASITPRLKGREITHQRSPRSSRTPWPSKACSSSPSPERGGRVKGEGRRDDRSVEEWIIYSNPITSIITKGEKNSTQLFTWPSEESLAFTKSRGKQSPWMAPALNMAAMEEYGGGQLVLPSGSEWCSKALHPHKVQYCIRGELI